MPLFGLSIGSCDRKYRSEGEGGQSYSFKFDQQTGLASSHQQVFTRLEEFTRIFTRCVMVRSEAIKTRQGKDTKKQ